jgi:signal transduction histidine kinase
MNKPDKPDALYGDLPHPRASNGDLATRLRNQSTMIGTVAHDLRLPLFRLAIAVELASHEDNDRGAFERNLEGIVTALSSTTRMVDDLDDYGSLQAGQLRLLRRSTAPAAVVRAAMAVFAPIAAVRQIESSERIGDALPDILADSDRLQQVLSNLLANALCLTPPGGRIVIAVHGDGDQVRFVVSGSGATIDPPDVPHVFERDWRGTNGRHVGRGMGLVIARALVEGHGGRIWADNEPGCGARFSFTVPVRSPDDRESSAVHRSMV